MCLCVCVCVTPRCPLLMRTVRQWPRAPRCPVVTTLTMALPPRSQAQARTGPCPIRTSVQSMTYSLSMETSWAPERCSRYVKMCQKARTAGPLLHTHVARLPWREPEDVPEKHALLARFWHDQLPLSLSFPLLLLHFPLLPSLLLPFPCVKGAWVKAALCAVLTWYACRSFTAG